MWGACCSSYILFQVNSNVLNCLTVSLFPNALLHKFVDIVFKLEPYLQFFNQVSNVIINLLLAARFMLQGSLVALVLGTTFHPPVIDLVIVEMDERSLTPNCCASWI